MLLTIRQKVEVVIGSITFLLFGGYFRYIFIDHVSYYGKDIIITSLLFFVWMGITLILTNYISASLSASLSDYTPSIPDLPSLPSIDWGDYPCPA